MSLTLRWLGASDEELDRVAQTRMRCYAHAARELERYREGIRDDPRAGAGDFLLAELDGVAVGTVTSLPLTMWIRGAPLSCQGVAYVGTVKTHRRGSSARSQSSGPGVATRIMHETLRKGRENEAVVSALMPFRASFYEHFGYGLVERRYDWTTPLSILPTGAFDGVRFFEPADLPDLADCRQRVVERGQCDIERSPAVWQRFIHRSDDGFVVVDRPAGDDAIRGWAYFRHASEGGRDTLKVVEIGWDTPGVQGLTRLLHFFASLRDQYATAVFPLPADLPLNWLLKETQLPHRAVNHPTASCQPITRMQLRVLDHKRLIEAIRVAPGIRGSATVSVEESPEADGEARTSRFGIDLSEGRATFRANAAGSEAFACRDSIWAAIVCGDLPATSAVRLGLARGPADAASALDAFARGPAPFCMEAF